MRQTFTFALLALLLIGGACTEDDPETTILVTEEVLFASGEQLRILGRLITNQSINADDHGFYLASDENFSNPIIISLGPKEGPGRFIGETNGLNTDETYFVKAFMNLGSGPEFGNVIEASTLNPGIESFSPNFGKVDGELFILGRNFTSDTRVFFGDQEAEILDISFESRLTVRIPSPSNSSTAEIRVVVKEDELVFSETFEYQIGTYELIGIYPEAVKLYDNVFWKNGDNFYLGLGAVRRTSFYEKVFRYNPAGNLWDEVDFPGSPRSFAFATANYLGGGIRDLGRELGPNPFLLNRSFWRFNGAGFTQLADLPFDSRESVAFEIGSQLYVVGGKEGNTQEVRKYSPSTDSWTNLTDAPEAISAELAHFTYQNKQYFILATGELVSFDPNSDTWNSVSNYPGNLGQAYGFAEVIGDKAYVGAYQRTLEMWEFDLTNLSWKRKNDLPGATQNINVGHFTYNGNIYFLRVFEQAPIGANSMDFYRFNPEGI